MADARAEYGQNGGIFVQGNVWREEKFCKYSSYELMGLQFATRSMGGKTPLKLLSTRHFICC